MRPIIASRHDVDTTFGLRYGIPKIIEIEKRHQIKSTIFVRVDILKKNADISFLQYLERCGWEIGLHLRNTIDRPDIPSPEEELKFLRENVNVKVHGVTPCGAVIGHKGDITWRTMDSLSLDYMEAYGSPPVGVKTYVVPTHLSFDIYYIRRFGEDLGYQQFKKDLTRILKDQKIATVLTHPAWFTRSVGMAFNNVWKIRMSKLLLSLTGKRKMGRVYDRFLSDFKEAQFMKYIDIYMLDARERAF